MMVGSTKNDSGETSASDKGWCTLLRLYSPLPAFLDKTWRPGEFELVN